MPVVGPGQVLWHLSSLVSATSRRKQKEEQDVWLPSWEKLSCCQLLMPVFSLGMLNCSAQDPELMCLPSSSQPFPALLGCGMSWKEFSGVFKITAVGKAPVGKSCSCLGGNLPFPVTGQVMGMEQGESTGSSVVLSQKSSDGCGSTGMDRDPQQWLCIHSTI